MIRRVNHKLFDLRRTLADLATGPQALALLPLALLVGFWAGGGATLLVALLTLPALLVLAGIADRRHRAGAAGDGAGPVVADGRSLEEALDNILRKLRDRGGQAACLMLALDHFESVRNAQGARAAAAATDHVASRLRANLRRRDRVFFLGRGRFGIALSPARGLSADRVLQLAHRLRDEMQGPPRAAGPSPCFSACIGIGMTGEDGGTSGAELAVAASAALAAARDAGPGSVRLRHPAAGGAAPAPPPVPAPLTLLHSDLDRALANGEITAWFQPQLCTDTGQVSGVEALARWCHPRRGVVLPAHFLPRLERAGLSGQLQSVILSDSLSALGKWRRLGFDIPGVGVNFSPGDLNDPALADTVAWALDRHDLTPACLTAEILETVVAASPDDMIACNIRRLSDMGCRIDLTISAPAMPRSRRSSGSVSTG